MEIWQKIEWVFANFPHQNVRFGHWIAIEFTNFIQHLEKKKMWLFLGKNVHIPKILMQAIHNLF